jgi:hypothetical protein
MTLRRFALTVTTLQSLFFLACAESKPALSAPLPTSASTAVATPGKACTSSEECGHAFRCDGVQEKNERAVPQSGICTEAECHAAVAGFPQRSCAAGLECVCDDGYCLEHDVGSCAKSADAH